MADKAISVDSIKAFWNCQFHNPDKWDHNVLSSLVAELLTGLNWKLVRAAGIFAGSIVLMRQYGDMMGI
ncbi:hypothetical protein SASPL_138664 [Salvia splendens]|uniref:Uncharacterized protein n=1 Tax=Salvia splendens TaxID=180675 RepID=A0A8X8WX39_SALSN|nr:hypothetical protein SASPL_138664 [Salvia splendens]